VTVAPLPAPAARPIRQEAARIFVRSLSVEAHIGVYDHEHGRGQPLIIDVELEADLAEPERLSQTINYETIATAAKALAAAGHVQLVETFAWRLARQLLDDSRVTRVRVRVEKPQALAPDAAAAGVEVVLARDPA
jgi:dihydroneopterin aldolase